MKITFEKTTPERTFTRASTIPAGTVFTGTINGIVGPWLRTVFSLVNLRAVGASLTTSDAVIQNSVADYEPHEAELILR